MKPPAALGKTASCDTRVMVASDVVLLRWAWETFARGDLEAATEVLDPRVRWHGAATMSTRTAAGEHDPEAR
jgi:hypothetical protein